jgi:hypothetical protein
MICYLVFVGGGTLIGWLIGLAGGGIVLPAMAIMFACEALKAKKGDILNGGEISITRFP